MKPEPIRVASTPPAVSFKSRLVLFLRAVLLDAIVHRSCLLAADEEQPDESKLQTINKFCEEFNTTPVFYERSRCSSGYIVIWFLGGRSGRRGSFPDRISNSIKT